jgi:N-acetylglucosaminyldiphosphoundecaprenol N-acetyl-beta-D-mannosaminyltransferase
MGCNVDNLDMEETLEAIEGFIADGKTHQHVVVNVDKVVKAHWDPKLRDIINNCDLVNADGMPIVWASRLLGKPLKERVAGVDLFERLVARAASKGWRVFFLGARQEIVQRVAYKMLAKHPSLRIAGYRNGYWQPGEDEHVARSIADAQPDILFVAISSPKKEQFLGTYQSMMKTPFAMGVGGTFDVVCGKVKRAPLWMQKSGLEWFYRFLQEPRRMFRRYFVDDMYFFWLLVREMMKKAG